MNGVQQVTAALAHHGEGPIWDDVSATLCWVDVLAGDVLWMSRGGKVERHHVARVAAALRPRARGGMVVAVERGFALVEPDWSGTHLLSEIWRDTGVRMNDGGCDPQGRFYCGSMAYDAALGAGALYRLDPDGGSHLVFDDVTCSNGLAWSPDGGTVYYIDTGTQRVDAFDFDGPTATFANRRTVVSIDSAVGRPDGMTVDAEGGLWVAIWDGGAVHRYSPDGRLDAVIELPTPQVSACTFGGPGLNELFITTSRLGLDAPDPAAGALFVASPGVTGLRTLPFAG